MLLWRYFRWDYIYVSRLWVKWITFYYVVWASFNQWEVWREKSWGPGEKKGFSLQTAFGRAALLAPSCDFGPWACLAGFTLASLQNHMSQILQISLSLSFCFSLDIYLLSVCLDNTYHLPMYSKIYCVHVLPVCLPY